MNIKIGRKEGWDFSSNGFEIEDIGITKSQKTLFEQTFAFRNYGITGKPVVNFILIYNGTAELTLTDFANTPVGTEIRTPNVEGVFSYYHEKKSNPASANDWATITKGVAVEEDSRPYKVYTALLTQTGTNAPTATVLENTLGFNIVWSRNNVGIYFGIPDDKPNHGLDFNEDKTLIMLGGKISSSSLVGITRIFFVTSFPDNYNQIELYTPLTDGGVLTDIALAKTPIEIRVYP